MSFFNTPETRYYEPSSKKRATSRAREVMRDAAQKAQMQFKRRPDIMTCLVCQQEDVLFFCRECAFKRRISTIVAGPPTTAS